MMTRMPRPGKDDGWVRVIAPIQIDIPALVEVGNSFNSYRGYKLSTDIPHITMVGGRRRTDVGPVQWEDELAAYLEEHQQMLAALGKSILTFGRLGCFPNSPLSVIWLDPGLCKELRAVQAKLYQFAMTSLVDIEHWRYDPSTWVPHLTVCRLTARQISRDQVRQVGVTMTGSAENLTALTSPHDLRVYDFAAR